MTVADAPSLTTTTETNRESSTRWWMVTCLTLLMILAQLDKYTISLLVAPIKSDLRLNDVEMGLILGSAFALAHVAILGPAGWLADRYSRRAIVQTGVAIWSLMAAACGAAQSFITLFIARAGVGLGEGLYPPAAYSLIRDGVAPNQRGRAFAMFSAANSFGAGLSLLLGGLLVGAIHKSGISVVPVFGEVKPWQLALILIGLIGLPLSLFSWTFRDPGRGQTHFSEASSMAQAWSEVSCHGRIHAALLVFSIGHASVATIFGVWGPAFLGRRFGLSPQEIGPLLGSLLVIVAPAGLTIVGLLIDKVGAGSLKAISLIAIAAATIFLAVAVLLPFSPSLPVYWLLQGSVILTSTSYLAITSTVVSQITMPRSTGKILSVYLLLQALIGAGLAPLIVGALSDKLFAGTELALGHAMATGGAIFGGIALFSAVCLWRAAHRQPLKSTDVQAVAVKVTRPA